MPYCSKCGVEVDYRIEECPLCDFPIPEIKPEEEQENDRFPTPENIYPQKVKKRKRRAFVTISVIFLSSIGLMLFQNISGSGTLTWAKYSIVSIIAGWIYLFFLLELIHKFRTSLIGISINTIVLLYFLDIFNGELEWFVLIGLPCVFMCTVATIIIAYIFKKTRKKGFNIASYIILAIVLYCIGIDAFISLQTKHYVQLYWSIIVAISLLPISILFLYLHYGLPEKYMIKLKRKFHF